MHIGYHSGIAPASENTIMVLDGSREGSYRSQMSWMRHFRQKLGLTQSQLAERVGTSQPQIKRLETENGGEKRKLTKEWAEKIAPGLGVQPEDLLFGPRTVLVSGYVGAGGLAYFYEDGGGEEVPRPPGSSAEIVALVTKGGSMPGVAEDNWLIYYDEQKDEVTPDMLGELCVVRLVDGRTLVKKVYAGSKPGFFNLISIAYEDIRDVQVEWAAKVEWIRPR